MSANGLTIPGMGMFWLFNSLNAFAMGEKNREEQMRAAEQSIEFQLEMERARNISEDERVREEIAFKRAFFDIQRNNRQKESAEQFSLRRMATELDVYLKKDWPLAPELLNVFLDEIEAAKDKSNHQLNAILMHTSISSEIDRDVYEVLEYLVNDDVCLIGDVNYRHGACVVTDRRGGNSSVMNIHFLLSALPTLVILPRCIDGRMSFNAAVWEPLSARPLVRPLFSIPLRPEKMLEDSYRDDALALMRASIDVIIGVVRDSYMMLTQGKNPTIGKWLDDKKDLKQLVLSNEGILDFIRREMNSIVVALTAKNNPKLLDIYFEIDIEYMVEQVKSIDLTK